ncbi:MAG: glycosyltransferase [Bacteroidota bacterium]|nr:glycosyltransferase [Bacteroidota bacterium]MDX5430801.1 glycosyltransferase [Bacteroidota bacterium]MDX5469546.1 glycosyltransferase [Bacteroidota bacterium]
MKFLNEYLIPFLNYGIMIYAVVISASYLILSRISSRFLTNYIHRTRHVKFDRYVASPLAPRVSIIAPAYNEGMTVIENVKSLLSLRYVNYEVIVINDGSKDDTLEKLIQHFKLTKTNFYFEEKIPCKEVLGVYRSSNPAFNKLWVIDKANGGKADALNSGINLANGEYCACIDVDCILEPDAILRMIKPMMEARKKRVIASGGVVRIANNCEVKAGRLTKVHLPKSKLALFQVVEYLRVFLLGRLAWAKLDGLLLISGAFGLFDREIVIEAGGYNHETVGEDMELVVRMRRMMNEQKRPYTVTFIPDPLCWTEAPESRKILSRQRNRWTRGTIETLRDHRKMFFNKKYGVLGLLSFPYWFFFEWLAPLIEMAGLLYTIYLFATEHINFTFFLLLLLAVYTFALFISFFAIQTDLKTYDMYKDRGNQRRMMWAAMLEPFSFHPANTWNAIRGNWDFIRGKKSWGQMTRTGFTETKKP